VLEDDGSYAAWIGVEAEKDVSIADLEPKIFEVRLKDGQPSAVPSDFRAQFLIPTVSSGAALKISLLASAGLLKAACAPLGRAGTYWKHGLLQLGQSTRTTGGGLL
jgi:hypothetical protein